MALALGRSSKVRAGAWIKGLGLKVREFYAPVAEAHLWYDARDQASQQKSLKREMGLRCIGLLQVWELGVHGLGVHPDA